MGKASSPYCMNRAGMTLVEILIAMAIIGVIMGALTNTLVTQRKVYTLQENVSGMTQQVQTAMEIITREIRNTGTNTTGATFTPVTYNATQLELRTDRNGNGNTNDPDEHIIYAYDATTRRITRDAGNGAQPLAENIQTFTFDYLDSANPPQAVTVSSAIRQIRVTVTARTATPDPTYTSNGGYRTYSLTSLIALRN